MKKNGFKFFASFILLLLFVNSIYSQNNLLKFNSTANITVSTLAGSGTAGFADGTGTAAQFNSPYGVAVDATGNVYVADRINHSIRKITASGLVTILAGSGIAGFADGTGTAAQFNKPSDVAIDTAGNVYVADTYNQRIRKITASGAVTTLAGSGIAGFTDGTGTVALFNYPAGVAVDATGNVYVADESNNLIRKITASGDVMTLAGSGIGGFLNGIGTSSKFYHPKGIAVDGAGNVYVGDFTNNRIRKITPAGVVTSLAGYSATGFADGTGTAALFWGPAGVAVDTAGNVYVADVINNSIRKITASGIVTTLAGTTGTAGFADGTSTAAQFNYPFDVAVDGAGNVYVADSNNNRIRKITGNTTLSIEDNIIKGFELYPNPVKNVFNITTQEQIKEVDVYNLLGQLLKQQEVNNDEITVNVKELSAGIYFVKIKTDKTLKSVKIFKE